MQPWQQPPPPKSNSTTWIILLVVGLVVVLFVVPLMIGVVVGIMSFRHRAATVAAATATPTATPASMTESYSTTNKLITIHYPPDFAAKSVDDSTVIITRNLGGGDTELVTFGAVLNAITNDPHELGRILLTDLGKQVKASGGSYTKNSEKPASCLGKFPGVETEATYILPPASAYLSKACFWIDGTNGYELRYEVPKTRAATEGPFLESIEAAMDFNVPAPATKKR
jgi:hypothetical protein